MVIPTKYKQNSQNLHHSGVLLWWIKSKDRKEEVIVIEVEILEKNI